MVWANYHMHNHLYVRHLTSHFTNVDLNSKDVPAQNFLTSFMRIDTRLVHCEHTIFLNIARKKVLGYKNFLHCGYYNLGYN